YSDSYDQHLLDLQEVFSVLARDRWRAKLKKLQLARTEVDYLGHRVGNGRVLPLERNIDKLKQMKKPGTPDDLISFLGLCGYYKRFIQGYSYLVEPLRKLTHSKDAWAWSAECEETYQVLLRCLTSYPILRLPDTTKQFIVKTDASSFAWGAVLAQPYEDV